MKILYACILGGLCAATACNSEQIKAPPFPGSTTIKLEADAEGNLRYCENDGATEADCPRYPNPRACAVLEVRIDTATGASCETCYDVEGTIVNESCEDTLIACTLITTPDPDCVVCAHVEGPVVYSSCTVRPPDDGDCVEETASNGTTCRRCFDGSGRPTLDECRNECALVECLPLVCSDGFTAYTAPGECCPICIPVDDSCAEEICPADAALLECPEGWDVVRDDLDCCYYHCAPQACTVFDGQPTPAGGPMGSSENGTTSVNCNPGYTWEVLPPDCGRCAPIDMGIPECTSDSDCGPEQVCTTSLGDCRSNCGDGPSGSGGPEDPGAACLDVCAGYCVDKNPTCFETMPAIAEYCEGEWLQMPANPGSCPEPPICVCPDGNTTLDGACADNSGSCDVVDCMPPDCDAQTEELVMAYPYCCGICLPIDRCTPLDSVDQPIACPQVVCIQGYHTAPGDDCCDTCVPDERFCETSETCLYGTVCGPNGVCIPNPDSCQETDGGITPYVAGKTTIQRGDRLDALVDSCDGNSTLVERYCATAFAGIPYAEPASIRVECEAGCADGACIDPTGGLTGPDPLPPG